MPTHMDGAQAKRIAEAMSKMSLTVLEQSEGKIPMTKTRKRLYSVWGNMHRRCENPKQKYWKHYGGRGITVCDEWREFEPFFDWAIRHGQRKGLILDRENNDKGYSPDNCRFTTPKISSNNKRDNVIIEWRGERHTIAEWTDKLKIPYARTAVRIFRGWTPDEAFLTTIDRRKDKLPNRGGLNKNNKTGFKGVHSRAGHRGWTAQVTRKGKSVLLGTFDSPEEAAHAYDKFVSAYCSDPRGLNFPT